MRTAPGLEVTLFAHEPEIRQPVAMQFDARGRLWVLQYLQYPNPAGLKAVEVDQYLRTQYDRIPEPPPKGPRGDDRLTICEDTDGDGRADRFKDFTSGLNLASGFALGQGGVYVAQPPYLLFYPDRNGDDAPDADPEVILSGFGMEDSHAFVNSLQWGPDGWLYGAQGSTVTAQVRGLRFQQGIWRYHPGTRAFELFAEGGGNTWGVDFTADGELIAGTNYGDEVALHQVQGAYYVKNFGKHGELQNPHAYGYLKHVPYRGFRGGHVTCGGIVYHGGLLPSEWEGAYIAANPLANAVYWHRLQRSGSSFTGSFGGELLVSSDTTFRPVDLASGPDGAIYIADWADQRLTHLDPKDNWDRSNGRIYRLAPKNLARSTPPLLWGLSARELIPYLTHSNHIYSREARRLLAENPDPDLVEGLARRVESATGREALECLWALHGLGGLTPGRAAGWVSHREPAIRKWVVRLCGDAGRLHPKVASAVLAQSRREEDPLVRSQMGSSAQRLPPEQALPWIEALASHAADAADPHIPLLLWWAVERQVQNDPVAVVRFASRSEFLQLPVVEKHVLERLGRRFASAGDLRGLSSLLEAAGTGQKRKLLEGLEQGLAGAASIPSALAKQLDDLPAEVRSAPFFLRLRLKLGEAGAVEATRAFLLSGAPAGEKQALMGTLGAVPIPESTALLLHLLEGPRELRLPAVQALSRHEHPEIPPRLLGQYAAADREMKNRIRQVLASRPEWARILLEAVSGSRIPPGDFTTDDLRRIGLHRDAALDAAVIRHWGRLRAEVSAEKEKRFHEVRLLLSPSGETQRLKGDAAPGKKLFTALCATCHGTGPDQALGPNLAGLDRKNREALIRNIVDPSAFIRSEYVSHDLELLDGQVHSGMILESDAQFLVLLDRSREKVRVERSRIRRMSPSPDSYMPEGLLDGLAPQQVADLFAYLEQDHAGGGP